MTMVYWDDTPLHRISKRSERCSYHQEMGKASQSKRRGSNGEAPEDGELEISFR